jgi:hypothetical protein
MRDHGFCGRLYLHTGELTFSYLNTFLLTMSTTIRRDFSTLSVLVLVGLVGGQVAAEQLGACASATGRAQLHIKAL